MNSHCQVELLNLRKVSVRRNKEEHAEYTWCIYITFYTHLIWFFALNRLNFQVVEVEINLQQS
jgi:hypothetical protein